MTYVDTHNHQRFWSPDAVNDVETLLAEAKALGLVGLTLTDHYDYNGEPNDWCLDERAYAAHMETVRIEDRSPFLYYGLEIDYQEEHREHLLSVASGFDFDLVLVSKHFFLGIDPYSRPDLIETTFGDLSTYVDTVIREIAKSAAAMPLGNSIAHYCYCSRYAPWTKSKFLLALAPAAFDSLFETIIANGQSLEINLQTIDKLMKRGYSFKEALPDQAIFRRYFARGGRLISLSSDSHRPGQLGKYHEPVISMLKDIGFTHLSHFVRRKLVLTPI